MAVLTGTRQRREAWIEWLDHCRGGKFANQLFFGKTIGGVPDVWAPAIVALEQALQAGGYTPKSAWAYNFRGIGGATCTCSDFGRCSLHSNGIAIDIDPRLNPLIRTSTFRWSDTAFTPEQIAFVEGIDNTKGEQMWSWGGRWGSIKDYMHFEANVDPGSTDVDWTTVPGDTGEDMPLSEADLEAIRGLIREELDRRVSGKPGDVNSFYGVGQRVATTLIGRSDRNIGEYLQKTFTMVGAILKKVNEPHPDHPDHPDHPTMGPQED